VVDFDPASGSVVLVPFGAALCAITRPCAERTLPHFQPRVEIDVARVSRTIGQDFEDRYRSLGMIRTF
jgi:hypothetical protein